jgi:hypothetical protein
MPLAAMVDGLVANYLGEADVAQVVQKLFPPPPRFNPSAAARAPGKPAPPPSFTAAWAKMDLSHLWGFPAFEGGVYEVLQANFGELSSIFSQYAKGGTAGSSSMTALMTMQTTEFTSFALDCGLTTDAFPAARLNSIFLRADQVDDEKKTGVDASKVATSADTHSSVQQGDHGLTMVEFMEALVACALYRANPKLGELGFSDDDAIALPGCLETLLKNHVLLNAKRDKLALVKSSLETDADVLAVLPDLKKRLQKTTPESKSFDDVTKTGVRKVFGKQVMSMDLLQDELTSRRVTKEITIHPTPKVKGDSYAPRHCNLSWLDAKGAFKTAQWVRDGRDTAETAEVLPRTELRTGEQRARSDALPLTASQHEAGRAQHWHTCSRG